MDKTKEKLIYFGTKEELSEKPCIKKLEEFVYESDYGVGAEAVPYDGRNKYIRITDIDEKGNFSPKKLTSPSFGIEERYRVLENDILIARTGNSVGKSYLYSSEDGLLYFAGFLIRFKIIGISPKYMKQFLETKYYWNQVHIISARSGQPGINNKEFLEFKVPTYETYTNQIIGDMLSSIDNLINVFSVNLSSISSLFVYMSKLCFTKPDSFIELGKLAKIRYGYTPPTNTEENFNGQNIWFSVSDMNKKYLSESKRHLSDKILVENKMIPANTVIMSFKLTVGKVGITTIDSYSNEAIANFTDLETISTEYLYYSLASINIEKYGSQAAQGITLNSESLNSIKIPIVKDMDLTVKLLTLMDNLIKIEEEKLEKLELMKKFHLQQFFY